MSVAAEEVAEEAAAAAAAAEATTSISGREREGEFDNRPVFLFRVPNNLHDRRGHKLLAFPAE